MDSQMALTQPSVGVQSARVKIPTWDGEPEKLQEYRLDTLMFYKSYKINDRYVCGPQLMWNLGPRARFLAQTSPNVKEVDEVDHNGTLIGWDRVFDYLLEKLDPTDKNELVTDKESAIQLVHSLSASQMKLLVRSLFPELGWADRPLNDASDAFCCSKGVPESDPGTAVCQFKNEPSGGRMRDPTRIRCMVCQPSFTIRDNSATYGCL